MLGRRSTAVTMVAALLSVVLLAACGSGPSAERLAREAARAFKEAPVKTVQGSFVDGVIPVSLKVTAGANGGATGTGTFDHFPVSYVQGPKSTFVQGTQYWAWERLTSWQTWSGLGTTWVKTAADWDPATNAFQRGARATGLAALLGADAGQVSLGPSARLEGHRVQELVDGPVTYDVTATAPHRLVAVHDPSQRVGGTMLGQARFSIAYGGAPPQKPPAAGHYVDQNDPSTLPAKYDVSNVNQSCYTDGSCAVKGTVQNFAGAPVGQGVVIFTEWDWPKYTTDLGDCRVAIPALGHDASTTLKCTVSGPHSRGGSREDPR